MEEYYNMYTINEDGKRIEREVPSNLASLYEKSGWKYILEDNNNIKVKKDEEVEEKSSFTSKFVTKKNDNTKNNKN